MALDVDNVLIKVGDQVRAQWHEFGLVIGVPQHVLDQLTGEDKRCLTQVICYWLRHHPGHPTWQEVTEAQRTVQSKC